MMCAGDRAVCAVFRGQSCVYSAQGTSVCVQCSGDRAVCAVCREHLCVCSVHGTELSTHIDLPDIAVL